MPRALANLLSPRHDEKFHPRRISVIRNTFLDTARTRLLLCKVKNECRTKPAPALSSSRVEPETRIRKARFRQVRRSHALR